MIFQKPKGMKYTDMCIYVDKKVQQDNITEEEASICFEYLYHIIYMLAIKNKYFHKEEYYDEFAITLAGDVFHRLFTHPKLKEFDEYGNPLLPKMKSCLNYIKAILYGRKVAFEQKNYSQKYLDIADVSNKKYVPTSEPYGQIRDNLSFTSDIFTGMYIENISGTVKQYLQTHSPYRNQPILFKNIYISCLLSIINAMVLTQEDEERLESKYTTYEAKVRHLHRTYKRNRENCVCLYHLSSIYKNYITVVVRQLFYVIGKEIKECSHENISVTEDVLFNISLLEVAGRDTQDEH